MDLEEAFQHVGEFGGHQKRMIAVLTLLQVMLNLAALNIQHSFDIHNSNLLRNEEINIPYLTNIFSLCIFVIVNQVLRI